MAADLQERKLKNILSPGVDTVATANSGCHLQLIDGARRAGRTLEVAHPISLLARAYRAERELNGPEFNL
jgi:glycolate oxidase iron-sulfur subunit